MPPLRHLAPSKASLRLAGFVGVGIILGVAGFWGLPRLSDMVVTYDTELFGATMFMFMFWIFINLHHYFLDNVIWRRENPETGKFLFAHR